MNSSSLLLLALSALFALSALAAPTTKQTISIKAKHVPVSSEHFEAIAKTKSPYHPLNQMAAWKSRHASRPGETSAVPLLDYYQWFLVGNISIGSPPQTFAVVFDIWDSDLSVIDVNANVTWSSNSSYYLSRKNLFNTTASLTATLSNSNMTNDWNDQGVIVNDNINIGGLSLNADLGDLTTLNSWLPWYRVDGLLGLSPKPSNNTGLVNLLKQLSGSLAMPVLTMHVNRTTNYDWWTGGRYANDTDAEIVLGTNNLPQCDNNKWTPIQLNTPSLEQYAPFVVNATAIASSKPGCNAQVKLNQPVWFVDWFSVMVVSYQVEELFVQASNAQFNSSSGWYTVPDMSNATSVNISLADGSMITLNPRNYIVPYKGINYLYVYGWYNEDDTNFSDYPIYIGQQWLNDHCISYNVNVNTLSVTDALPNNGNPTTQ
jgi:hypothetical protein